MPSRRSLLKILLWTIVVSAAAGVVGILFAPSAVAWRIVGTGALASGATLLSIPLILMTDSKRWRLSGFFGLAGLIIDFLLYLTLIWDIYLLAPFAWNLHDRIIVTAFGIVLPATILSALFLYLRHLARARVAAQAELVILATYVLFTLFLAWMPYEFQPAWIQDSGKGWLLAIGFILFGHGAVGALFGIGFRIKEQGGIGQLRWIGPACAAAGLGFVSAALWGSDDEFYAKFIAVFGGATAATAIANLLHLLQLRAGQFWVRWFTIAAAVGATASFDAWVFIEGWMGSDAAFALRFSGACAVLASFGIIGILIVARLNARTTGEHAAPIEGLQRVTLTCPNCQEQLSLQPNITEKWFTTDCPSCGLTIDMRVRAPHCEECGYTLLGIRDAQCPECGTKR